MSKKGISQIKGPSEIKIGETAWYEVSRIHRLEDQSKVVTAKWELSKRENGKWRTLRSKAGTPSKIGAKVPVTITNPTLVNQELLIEAYIYEAEKTTPPGLKVKIMPAVKKKITRVELFMADETPITKDTILKYNQTIKVKVYTQAMQGEMLTLLLYEDDATGGGHHAKNEPNKVDEKTKTLDENGFLWHEFKLQPNFSAIANAMMDGSKDKLHEYYVVVKTAEHKSVSKNVEVENPDYIVEQTVSGGKPPEEEKVIEIEEVVIKGKRKTEIGVDPIPPSGNKTVVVENTEIEDLLDAYFAKEEYTKETDESAGNYTYAFKSVNNNIDKDKISAIIKKNVDSSIKADKKYTKLEAIKNSLVKTSYAKGETISFATYKLGAEYKRINNAPLEEEVYVVASTMNLDGKEVSLNIYEKDEVLKGKFEIIPVLEAKENGSELTTLKATVEKGIAKVKVKLRPKSDEDLKKWKEKLQGVKDGSHTYTFGGNNDISTEAKKKSVAQVIIGKVKQQLASSNKFAKAEDIVTAFNKIPTKTSYGKDEQITFDVYKTITEQWWLKAKVTGKEEHNKEFLKEDGKYFKIGGGKCGCKIDEDFFFTNYNIEFPNKDRNNNVIPMSENTKSSLRKMFESTSEYYANEKRCCNLKHIAYMLATAKLETANTFNPINEYGGNSYFERMYDPVLGKDSNRRQMAKDNENTTQGDGVKYHGRGFVQLTWKKNYRRMKEKFGVDLINHPEKALEHELAMKIMIYGMEEGSFTNKKLTDYINESKTDYLNARRIINGTDRASDIKNYAEKIEKCLKIEECNCNGESRSNSDVNSNVNIHFVGQSAHEEAVSQNSRRILQEVGEATNNLDIYITSTARTPYDQARIMYDNCRSDLQEQRRTYLGPGQRVIDVYVANQNKPRNTVISLMEAKINELGSSTVSRHCADHNVLNVFDISIRRLSNSNNFLTNLQSRAEVSQVLIENGVYHVEIPQ